MMNKQLTVRMDERTKPCTPMRGSRKFCQRGSIFFFDEGIDDPNITFNGPLSARQRNVIFTGEPTWPNIECWHGSFVIFQGIRISIANKTNNFMIFQGGPDPMYPLWICPGTPTLLMLKQVRKNSRWQKS